MKRLRQITLALFSNARQAAIAAEAGFADHCLADLYRAEELLTRAEANLHELLRHVQREKARVICRRAA